MNTEIRKSIKSYRVKGDLIEFEEELLYDINTNKEIYSKELDDKNDLKLYNIYREKHNLLFPEEIVKIRESYKMSQEEFCKNFGFTHGSIARYEKGSIQSREHNDLLLLIRDGLKRI